MLLLIAVAACGNGDDGDDAPLRVPVIDSASVAAGPHNVLSAVVDAWVRDADSMAVPYGMGGGPLDSVTPALAADVSRRLLPVLGLLPSTGYELRVVAWTRDTLVEGPPLPLVTGPLPPDLPRFTASGPDPLPGFVVFALGTRGLVIDNTGRVVWYRDLPGGPTLNFQAQPTGTYASSPVTAQAGDLAPWLELDPLGNPVRRFGCARGLRSRFHEALLEPDGSYWLLCDETRTQDLTAFGGVANAQVTGTVAQHIDAAGALRFEWNAFDHFLITDVDSASRAGPTVNWTHGNALDFDADGNLLLSFRSLSEVTKVDVRTGAVLWRMGGRRNQFAFDAPGAPFVRQHGVRSLGAGRLQLFDNLGEPGGSRAERWEFDAAARTARRLAGYESAPATVTQLGGTTQPLPGGRMLVAYGNGNRVEEYDAAGGVTWRIVGDPGYVFRAQRIWSLYAPGAGAPR
ncbi:MAG: arylsulfotransferase family protein [Gemmatimonadales bacterium]|nr:arylsulfotransferase family protein [Gemmatimonadales bacterium]